MAAKTARSSRTPENMKLIAHRRGQIIAFGQAVLKETTVSEARVAQGLAPTVVDTTALARVAGLLNRRGAK